MKNFAEGCKLNGIRKAERGMEIACKTIALLNKKACHVYSILCNVCAISCDVLVYSIFGY